MKPQIKINNRSREKDEKNHNSDELFIKPYFDDRLYEGEKRNDYSGSCRNLEI